MKRLMLATLLVGFATVTVPPLRERADPHIEAFRLWLGRKLEGPLSPILTPYRKVKVQTEEGKFIGRLTGERNRGQAPPRANEVTDYLVARKLSDDGLDPWGMPYTLEQTRDSLYIVSAGPDVTYATDDDVRDSMYYPAPRRSRRRGPRGR